MAESQELVGRRVYRPRTGRTGTVVEVSGEDCRVRWEESAGANAESWVGRGCLDLLEEGRQPAEAVNP